MGRPAGTLIILVMRRRAPDFFHGHALTAGTARGPRTLSGRADDGTASPVTGVGPDGPGTRRAPGADPAARGWSAPRWERS
ncbi:hypothetical protein SAMN05428944_1029 [Streptomyces sp. 1222.5]|nr:hypothetical protein BX260_7066 [Streptomyces sp. 5112.2]SEB71027.1 hypothetical protein SAMN05428944_1029 [Streptomyces sp. 1222.5]